MVQDPLVPPLEGEPDQIVPDEDLVEFFGLDIRRKRADRAGHFSNCCWVLVEAKTRYKIAKAIEQLKETVDQIDHSKFAICYLVVVYESLGQESRLFEVVEREKTKILWNKVIPRGGPVLIRDKEVIALKPKEIKAMYEQRRLEAAE